MTLTMRARPWRDDATDDEPPARPEPQTVRSFTFDVTCPQCDGTVYLLNTGTTNGLNAKAVVRCDSCSAAWLIEARIERASLGKARHDFTPPR